MKRHILLIVFIGILLPIYAQVATPPSAGDGTEMNPYQIANLENLYWITADTLNFDKHYVQTADIDASDTQNWFVGDHDDDDLTPAVTMGWKPIGTATSYENAFTGVYNGQGHIIDSLYINRPTEYYVGLFGFLSGEISNLGVSNVNITGSSSVGALVGINYQNVNDISKCYSSGSVKGNAQTGGLIGYNRSYLENCFSLCEVNGNYYVGGLIGYNSVPFKNCYSTGLVVGVSEIGGLVAGDLSVFIDTSFWDIETSGVYADLHHVIGIGLTTDKMQTLSTFTDAGWDFVAEIANGTEDIWNINPVINNGYPYLSWQSFPSDSLACTLLSDIVNTTINSSTANCYITNLGSSNITQHGVCWNTTGVPTIADDKTEEGLADSIGVFNSDITGINANTKYYIRAYVTNSEETIYSNEINFYSAPVDPIQPEGNGLEVDPYIISNLENLYWMTQNKDEWERKYYIQVSDINASPTINWFDNAGWEPLGNYSYIFYSIYDGQGHLIDSLYINRPTDSYIGLFGISLRDIIDLGLTNVNITGFDYVGALVGYNVYDISMCYSSGFVNGNECIGGLIGYYDYGIVENSFSLCEVNGGEYIGGLIGYNRGTPKYCYSTGQVVGSGSYIGGFVGVGWGDYTNFWDIETSGQTSSEVGTGLTTEEMKTISTFTDSGWDFVGESANGTEDIWDINGVTNGGYPFLSWMSISIDNEQFTVDNYSLEQNYPNPFNPSTTIRFSIPSMQDVKLSVYNSNGQLVNELVNDKLSKGNHSVLFNAESLNSGIYFYTLQTDGKKISNKMLLIK